MEANILSTEAELEALQSRMQEPDIMTDAQKLAEYWQRQQALSQAVEAMYQRWSELEEKLGK